MMRSLVQQLALSNSKLQSLTQLSSPDAATAEACIWTRDEDKLFESLLLEFPEGSANRWGSVASRLSTKSVDQVVKHYEDLVVDVYAIESGLIPVPNDMDCFDDDDAMTIRFYETEEPGRKYFLQQDNGTKTRKRNNIHDIDLNVSASPEEESLLMDDPHLVYDQHEDQNLALIGLEFAMMFPRYESQLLQQGLVQKAQQGQQTTSHHDH